MVTVTEQKPETMLDQVALGNRISDLISAQLSHKNTHKCC